MNRRTLIAGLAGAAGMAAFGAGAATPRAARRLFFEANGLPIGLQLYTLGDEAGRDLDATLAAVAAIGYRDLELPSLYGRSARDVRAAADRAGLAISSLHVPISTRGQPGLSFASPAAEIAETLVTLGASHAVAPIGVFPDGLRPQAGETMQAAIARAFAAAGEDPWKRTAAAVNPIAVALKAQGLHVGYHNHNLEFAPIGATTGWDILLREFDPAVEFEIDVGWVTAGGLDPVDFLARHRGRVTQLHVKDVAAGTKTNYALTMNPAEVGSGRQDWKRILPAAVAAGVRHFYVEQEPPFAIPRLDAARKSYAFLSALRASNDA
ncbi:MAG: sugar phosphate isomerase/epimerase [Novosphingobium sp.]